MNLKSLLLSSDDKTVRVLRRVLSDLEIDLEYLATSHDVIRRITRQRFEAIIVDCSNPEEAGNVIRAAKAAPVNKRALSIILVETVDGLKRGFDMGAHFVLHKPLTVERAKSSFRAVRALMKSERRLQLRVPVQVPVECVGSNRYEAKTLDVCEGGMALQFTGRKPNEKTLRFALTLPGMDCELNVWGEVAWLGTDEQIGVRFPNLTSEQRAALRSWLTRQLPGLEPDEPPVVFRVAELSAGGCYLTACTPFPRLTRVIISAPNPDGKVRAKGVVRIVHPEFGMGIEFFRSTPDQQTEVSNLIEIFRSSGKSTEVHVEADGLHTPSDEPSHDAANHDSLVNLFRHQAQLPVESFVARMEQRREPIGSH